jgi:YD repeat-containing protein
MRKTIIRFSFLLLMCNFLLPIKGQGKNYIEELNRNIPQSPGVSSLMKFEEVPVSLYTGIPDVNIPIGDFNTNSSKLNLSVSLNYHPLSAKVDDVASEYGLGWSLFAGGMISRTIRDLPDESTHSSQKYGMYYDTLPEKENNFNIVKDYLLNGTGSGLNNEKAKRQIFESVLFNRFDNSYDMYQYNFMGYTGRFFIKKDETTGQLKLVKLDKNNLIINFFFNTEKSPVKFEIIDDKGLKFVFDVIEKSSRSYLINSINSSNVNTNESLDYQDLNTGFYLGEVYEDAKQLLKFNYASPIGMAQSTTVSKKRGQQYPYETTLAYSSCYDDIMATYPANDEMSVSLNTTGTRFLNTIEVADRAKIYFEYAGNRQDSNLAMPNNHQKLTKITTKSYYGDNLIKQFNFVYTYSQNIENKMVLSTVNVLDKNLQKDYSYGLSYGGNGKPGLYGSDDIRSDLWGHYRCVQNTKILDILSPKAMFEPSPGCVEKDVLTKMILPTGGEIRYKYELNTYNYKPRSVTVSQDPSANAIEEVTDFSSNLRNWDTVSSSIIINNFGQSPLHFFTITEPQEITFNSGSGAYTGEPWALNFYKLNESTGQMQSTTIQPLGPIVDVDPNYITWQKRNFPAGKYYAVLSTVSGNMPQNPIPTNFTAGFMAYYRKPNQAENFLYGGGIRIKEVEFHNNSGNVQKKKLYEYNDIANTTKSSGALVFPVPVLQYEEYYSNFYMCIDPTSQFMTPHSLEMTYNTTATKNLLSPEKTRGADVGYKYITVKDIDYTVTNALVSKGRTLYEFSSPVDSPNSLFSYFSMSPPGAYALNFDYRRGNLLNKKVFDAGNNLVYQENNMYNDHFVTEISGINFLARKNFIFNRFATNDIDSYSVFKTAMGKCNLNSFLCQYTSAMGITVDPLSFIYYYFSKETVGKTNLIASEKTEYFPDGRKLVTIDHHEYNGWDYPLKISSTTLDNIINETSYKYSLEKGNMYLINKNIVSIPLETETKKNGVTISKIESLYPISQSEAIAKTSGLALPYRVNSTDLQNTVSQELSYDKYDEKGNILQYTTKDGIPVTIVWGYNNTQPIAKVEGITYDQLTSLASPTAIITASDNDAADPSKEGLLLTALNTFRKNSQLTGMKITTYTYDPLIGVTSITPPSGIRQAFTYDPANRLRETKVRSKDTTGAYTDKKAAEYKYNYKP